jgi:hypothetical protein
MDSWWIISCTKPQILFKTEGLKDGIRFSMLDAGFLMLVRRSKKNEDIKYQA